MGAAHRAKVLIVEDDDGKADLLRGALTPAFACEVAATPDAGLEALGREHFDVVLSGVSLSATHGLDLLDRVHRRAPHVPFILVGENGEFADAIDAGRRGAFDWVAKPLDRSTLCRTVERALSTRDVPTDDTHGHASPAPPSEDESRAGGSTLLGASPRFVEALEAVDRVAHSTAPVLLVGESGTGKDVLAARIHARGPRRHRPYVVINAAALPATLLDSELFGHVGGAFTGATRARRGLIAEADGGTLFLDEIADLPVELQGRLLRVIETGLIRAVGADHERRVDVRFVAATHRDLSHAVREKRFRSDLYYRLNVLTIAVPLLRERRDDIPLLADYFLQRARSRFPRAVVRELSPSAMEALVSAPWPGNVRELGGFVERLVVFGHRERVEAEQVREMLAPEAVMTSDPWPPDEFCSLKTLTHRYVEWVLARTGGDKARAASILGVDVSTLYRWQRRRPDEG